MNRARIYISFAASDRARAMQLVRWLNDSGWQVGSDDRHAFEIGDDWTDSVARRIEAFDVILLLITPRWLTSDFCRYEFSYCAKRGKFILPVICDLRDASVLPAAIRTLPSIDLTRHRLVDYLALKETLSQAGSNTDSAAAVEPPTKRIGVSAPLLRDRRYSLSLTALLLFAMAMAWLWVWD